MTDLTFNTATFLFIVLNVLVAVAIVFVLILFFNKLINKKIRKKKE